MTTTIEPPTANMPDQIAELKARTTAFETKLRDLTLYHPTDKAFRIINVKVRSFIAELEAVGIFAEVSATIGRQGAIVTSKLKE